MPRDQQPPRLPSSGPEPLEVLALIGIGIGWAFGGIGSIVGFAAVAFGRRWTPSQKVLAIFGPLAGLLAPLAVLGTGGSSGLGAILAVVLWIAGSIAAAIYLWWCLPGRDGTVH